MSVPTSVPLEPPEGFERPAQAQEVRCWGDEVDGVWILLVGMFERGRYEVFECEARYDHITIYFNRQNFEFTGNSLKCDLNIGGLFACHAEAMSTPEAIGPTVDRLGQQHDAAFEYYRTTLQLDTMPDDVDAAIHELSVEGFQGFTGYTLRGFVQYDRDINPSFGNTFPRHEAFHLFQAENINDFDALAPGRRVSWWTEATAEWGAGRMNRFLGDVPGETGYFNNLGSFLAETDDDIYDTLPTGERYGSFLFAEYLDELPVDLADDIIKDTWDRVGDGIPPKAATVAIEEALNARGANLRDTLVGFWVAAYNWDFAPGPGNADVARWRDRLPGGKLPSVDVELTAADPLFVEGGDTVGTGGAKFYAFDTDPAAPPTGSELGELTISGSVDPEIEVRVLRYGAYPDGAFPTVCGDRSVDVPAVVGGSFVTSVPLTVDCPLAVLVFVDATFSFDIDVEFPVTDFSFTAAFAAADATVDVSVPAPPVVVDNQYESNPFEVVATVTNMGQKVLDEATVALTELPGGLTTAEPLDQVVPTLNPGESADIVWNVTAADLFSDLDVDFQVELSAADLRPVIAVAQITIPALEPTVPIGGQPVFGLVATDGADVFTYDSGVWSHLLGTAGLGQILEVTTPERVPHIVTRYFTGPGATEAHVHRWTANGWEQIGVIPTPAGSSFEDASLVDLDGSLHLIVGFGTNTFVYQQQINGWVFRGSTNNGSGFTGVAHSTTIDGTPAAWFNDGATWWKYEAGALESRVSTLGPALDFAEVGSTLYSAHDGTPLAQSFTRVAWSTRTTLGSQAVGVTAHDGLLYAASTDGTTTFIERIVGGVLEPIGSGFDTVPVSVLRSGGSGLFAGTDDGLWIVDDTTGAFTHLSPGIALGSVVSIDIATDPGAISPIPTDIVNGGFETGDLTGWTTFDPGNPEVTFDVITGPTLPVRTGTHALNVTTLTFGPLGVEQLVQLTPGDSYELEGYVTESGGPSLVAMEVTRGDGSLIVRDEHQFTDPPHPWVRLAVTFEAPPSGLVKIRLVFEDQQFEIHELYFDDVAFVAPGPGVDASIMIDQSRHVVESDEDPENKRITAAHALVDAMSDNDRVAIVGYGGSSDSELLIPLTKLDTPENRTAIRTAIDQALDPPAGQPFYDMDEAFHDTIGHIDGSGPERARLALMIAGPGIDIPLQAAIDVANAESVTVYGLGFAEPDGTDDLVPLATGTGGRYETLGVDAAEITAQVQAIYADWAVLVPN